LKETGKEAVKVSADPIYPIIPNALIAFSYLQMGEFKEAEKIANATLSFHGKFGCEYHGTVASIILGGVMIARGKMTMGLKQIEDILLRFREWDFCTKQKKGTSRRKNVSRRPLKFLKNARRKYIWNKQKKP
jgi:hypothetical protein